MPRTNVLPSSVQSNRTNVKIPSLTPLTSTDDRVDFYNYFSVLLQEMNINLEEEIVVRVVNYVTKARGIFASEESVDDRDRWVSVIRRY